MGNYLRELAFSALNLKGWHTKRKYVVFESDDWGSIRMPSIDVYNSLLKLNIRVDKCHYNRLDSFETTDDLNSLYETLFTVKDINGNPAVLTANVLVANPDFERIRLDGFSKYHYLKLNEDKRINGEEIIQAYKKGLKAGCFVMQSHGREHLNIHRWMSYLNTNSNESRIAFDHGVYGISTTITLENRKSFLPAFDFENSEQESFVNEVAIDALRIFKDLFGYKSESFIPPNYTWGRGLESVLYNNGVKYLQGGFSHRYVTKNNRPESRRFRITGVKSKSGLIELSRNSGFEPSFKRDFDWVNNCIGDINKAFKLRKPAIISTHRVNYMGNMDITNRDVSLRLLEKLLKEIKKLWPDVEFMSSDELGKIILDSKTNERK